MEHPITPPPELVAQWDGHGKSRSDAAQILATAAARWGADQELEACCEWLPKYCPWDADQLRAARRPKPPSLKEQALRKLDDIYNDEKIDGHAYRTIFQALEALPND